MATEPLAAGVPTAEEVPGFGSVSFVRDKGAPVWEVRCLPHVSARLKRVFPRIRQDAAEAIRLSDTTQNARELEWFLGRFPMWMSDGDRERLTRSADQHRTDEATVQAVLAGQSRNKSAPARSRLVPELALAKPLRPYQELVPALLRACHGFLLADEVGLGKTVEAMAGMLLDNGLPALVVAPPHLQRQWQQQLEVFLPQLHVVILKKGQPYDLTLRGKGSERLRRSTRARPGTPGQQGQSACALQLDLLDGTVDVSEAAKPPVYPAIGSLPHVIISSYHMLRGWAEALAGKVRYVVFDECQQLRSPDTQIYTAARFVASAAELRLGLSASPIHNYGNEFFHVLQILAPDSLGTYDEFLREWCYSTGSGHQALKAPADFGSFLRREGLMLQRKRAEVGRDLPPITVVVHEVNADRDALDAIKGNAIELAKIVLQHGQQFRGQSMQAAGELDMLLRQATGVAKAPYVTEFVRLLLESGESVVLWGWHRAVYQIWLEGLADFKPAMFTGSESAAQKEAQKQRFISGETKLLIQSLRSGAGTDGLQEVCHIGVVGELDWSSTVHMQCGGRLRRDLQDLPVTMYYLVSKEGTDPYISEILGLKRQQFEGVMDPSQPLTQRADTGENTLRALARDFLTKNGVPLPEPPSAAPAANREPDATSQPLAIT